MMILTVGNEKPQKNLADVRRIAKLLPRHEFRIVTQGEDVPALMRQANIYLSCALWEGLPRAVVEALTHGLPVVAYGVGGIPEVVRHNWNGLLYQPGDFYNLAINLIHLIHSPDERKRMSENARKSIGKEFDINYMVEQLEDLYESHNRGRRRER